MNFDLFENILDSVWVFNSERELVFFNSASATLLDVSPKRIKKGKPVHNYLELLEGNTYFMPNGCSGKETELKLSEIPFKTFKGKEGIGLVSIKKLKTSETEDLWICLIRDITLEVSLHSKYHEKIREMQEANKKLEVYNKDLEKMVEERTIDLKTANKFLEAMMNSLGQGLVVFDEKLECNVNYTKICEKMFFSSPDGHLITNVLGIENEDSFKKWAGILLKNMIPFHDAAKLGPKFIDKDGRYVTLEYHPLKDGEKINGVVVVGTDKTEEKIAKDELEVKTQFVEMVTSILHKRKQFNVFRKEFKSGMKSINDLRNNKFKDFDESMLKITLHSLKGSSMVFSMKSISDKLHEIEDYLANTSIRDPKELELHFNELDKIQIDTFNQASELLGDKNSENPDELRTIELSKLESFRDFLIKCKAQNLADNFNDEFIKESLNSYFAGFNDLIIDVASELDKKIAPIHLPKSSFKIDTRHLDEFFNALPHLFRNCVYHGIETPKIRAEKKKNLEGNIHIEFELNNDESELVLIVSDDGAGIDLDKIRSKLEHIGNSEDQALDDSSLALKIFEPDISTSETVNKISGRGVGMHALKVAVDNLNGKLEVKTEKDKGTKFTFKIPLVA
ncbi:MAG: hypothetical protein KC493_09385 [Bacteriovoracaceae bacterium]|nr:hypothetical protein [Bacteriovoracaceae bacterium]